MKSVFDLSKYQRKDANSKLLTQIKQAALNDPTKTIEVKKSWSTVDQNLVELIKIINSFESELYQVT